MIEGERERWLEIRRQENVLRESRSLVWWWKRKTADGSYLFCWFETGRKEVAVNGDILGRSKFIHIHGPGPWREDI